MTAELTQHSSKTGLWPSPLFIGLLLGLSLGPLHLQRPITNDAVLYDLQSRWFNAGVLPYRDVVEVNFPGVLLVHWGTRQWLGDSGIALRSIDLLLVAAMLWALSRLILRGTDDSRLAAWSVICGMLFYFSLSEWGHCQRDVWLILPVLIGCLLRIDQVHRVMTSRPYVVFSHSLLEGVIWGTAIWLKPHALVMCLVVWGLSSFVLNGWRSRLADAGGLLAGGLLMGSLGVALLWRLEMLEPFLNSLREWAPGYLAARWENWTWQRYLGMNLWLTPWTLLHLLAIPLSLTTVGSFLLNRSPRHERFLIQAMLAGVYLVWFLQAHLLQHLFDYVHVPAVFLAILVLVLHAPDRSWLTARPLVAGFLAVALLASPLTNKQQLQLWPQCIRFAPLSPAERMQLARLPNPVWTDLQQIEDYLKSRQVRGRDVLMYNSDLVTLYWNLQLQSPTRFVYFNELYSYLPTHREAIQHALEQGQQRFVVTDLVGCGMPVQFAEEVGPQGPLAPPPRYRGMPVNIAPWNEPVVFRAGRYLVHEPRVPSSDSHETEAESARAVINTQSPVPTLTE